MAVLFEVDILWRIDQWGDRPDRLSGSHSLVVDPQPGGAGRECLVQLGAVGVTELVSDRVVPAVQRV